MYRATLLIVACGAVWCAAAAEPGSGGSYRWDLPVGFPKPRVPSDNPMTAEKVELGRHLFYDTRLSVNGAASCATCHKQELAFTDGKPVAVGATGEKHSRSAMSLVNIAYSAVLTWSNPGMKDLERQAMVPMFGTHPLELGLRQGGRKRFWRACAPIRNTRNYSRARLAGKRTASRCRTS